MTDILKKLAEISERAENATKGPWFTTEKHGVCRGDTFDLPEQYSVASAETVEDDDFIAHARTDIPALVEALKVAVEGLDDALDGLENDDWRCSRCDKDPEAKDSNSAYYLRETLEKISRILE